jgi:hypothetical protein
MSRSRSHNSCSRHWSSSSRNSVCIGKNCCGRSGINIVLTISGVYSTSGREPIRTACTSSSTNLVSYCVNWTYTSMIEDRRWFTSRYCIWTCEACGSHCGRCCILFTCDAFEVYRFCAWLACETCLHVCTVVSKPGWAYGANYCTCIIRYRPGVTRRTSSGRSFVCVSSQWTFGTFINRTRRSIIRAFGTFCTYIANIIVLSVKKHSRFAKSTLFQYCTCDTEGLFTHWTRCTISDTCGSFSITIRIHWARCTHIWEIPVGTNWTCITMSRCMSRCP